MDNKQSHTSRPMITAIGLRLLAKNQTRKDEPHEQAVERIFNEAKKTMMADNFEALLKAEATDEKQTRYLVVTMGSDGCGCPPCCCSCVVVDEGVRDVLNDVAHRLKQDPQTSQKIPAGATLRSSVYTDPCDGSHVLGNLYLDWSPSYSVNALCSRRMV